MDPLLRAQVVAYWQELIKNIYRAGGLAPPKPNSALLEQKRLEASLQRLIRALAGD